MEDPRLQYLPFVFYDATSVEKTNTLGFISKYELMDEKEAERFFASLCLEGRPWIQLSGEGAYNDSYLIAITYLCAKGSPGSSIITMRQVKSSELYLRSTLTDTSWWLDTSALPETQMWARLKIYDNKIAEILTCEGKRLRFISQAEAIEWLRQDEYESVQALLADGEIPTDTRIPSARSDEELLGLMIVDT